MPSTDPHSVPPRSKITPRMRRCVLGRDACRGGAGGGGAAGAPGSSRCGASGGFFLEAEE